MLHNIKKYRLIKKARVKLIEQMDKAQIIADRSHKATQIFEATGFKNRMENKLMYFDLKIKELSETSLGVRIMKMVGF